MLNYLYFKTTCSIRSHFLGPMGGLKIKGPLYVVVTSISHTVLTFEICMTNKKKIPEHGRKEDFRSPELLLARPNVKRQN